MGLLVKEYNIPFLGKIKLIEATGYEKSFNGRYFANNENMGVFCQKCESAKELIEKVGLKIKECIGYKIEEAEAKIMEEEKNKENLEGVLRKMTIKDDKLQDEESWLKEYQTDNPLQLEYQYAERKKGSKK